VGGSILATIVSVVVGGAVAAATTVGVINASTGTPEKSPVDVNEVSVEYGSN
jgi:hypothetical protein